LRKEGRRKKEVGEEKKERETGRKSGSI